MPDLEPNDSQKALKIIDWWIKHKKTMDTFQEKWTDLNDTCGLEKAMMNSDQRIIENLKLIRKELVPNCKHPKKIGTKLLMVSGIARIII